MVTVLSAAKELKGSLGAMLFHRERLYLERAVIGSDRRGFSNKM